MQRNVWVTAVACAVVFGGGGFYYGSHHAQAPSSTRFTQFPGGSRGGFAGRTGSNNALFGTIISKDTEGITIKLNALGATSTDGTASGTRIILVNTTTEIQRMTSASLSDLSVGDGVLISGTPNSDGSLTAQSIQVRPSAR